jgi:hypothetical protein
MPIASAWRPLVWSRVDSGISAESIYVREIVDIQEFAFILLLCKETSRMLYHLGVPI